MKAKAHTQETFVTECREINSNMYLTDYGGLYETNDCIVCISSLYDGH